MRRSYLACSAIAGIVLVACETPSYAPILPPKLAYSAPTNCAASVDLSKAIGITKDPKLVKRMMKNRTITRSRRMESSAQCLQGAEKAIPAMVFTLPPDLTGEVVYAGSILDYNSIFAADVSTLNANGDTVRTFERESYLFQGQQYGVQFRPSDEEVFVLIKADPELIGEERDTTELSVSSQNVSNYGAGGTYSSGTNLVGAQTAYNRTYAYDGMVQVRIVFPEQPETDSE